MADYKRKDFYYNQAKKEGIKSRAFYKLKEIQNKHRIIKPKDVVIDLGAWPGGWVQYASGVVGREGVVVGIDLVEIEDLELPNVKVLKGDIRDENTPEVLIGLCGRRADVLLSDMSPKLSGIKEVDQWAAIGLAESALYLGGELLKAGGSFVIKLFKGNESEEFVRSCRPHFKKTVRHELRSTRKGSKEYYLICTGFSPDSYKEANSE